MNADEIIKLLERIAEALTPSARQAWDIVMRQVLAEGRLEVILGWVAVGLAVILAILVVYLLTDQYNDHTGALAFGGMGLVGLIVAAAILLSNGYLKLANPSYYVIQRLISFLPK